MKYGVRKPSVKKSIKARTTGRAKRAVKKTVTPGYGKKGMGWVKDPQKAMYNKVYNKTTMGVRDIMSSSSHTTTPVAKSSYAQQDSDIQHAPIENESISSSNIGTHISPSRGIVVFGSGKELDEQGLKNYSLIFLIISIILIIVGVFIMPLGILFVIAGIITLIFSANYKQHRTDLLESIENYTTKGDYNIETNKTKNNFLDTDSVNKYHENIKKDHQNNSTITESDIAPFKHKPFSLSGEMMFDCGIPYFPPSDADKKIIERDIDYLVNRAIATGVFKTYKTSKYVESVQIRTQIYTPTKKIKKYPIIVALNDGITYYMLFYAQSGNLEKAELTYCPDNKTGYTINYKTFNESVEVRKICSYPIGGGSSTELYCRK